MQNMFTQFIDFSAINGLRFENIQFVSIDTADFPPVISLGYNDFFKEEKYDIDQFKATITDLIQPAHTTLLYCVLCFTFNNDDVSACYGIGYLDTFKIIPIQFELSENFKTWLDKLTGEMRQYNRKMEIGFSKNQMSQSGAIESNLFSDAEQFIRANAPKLYNLEKEQAEKRQFIENFVYLESMKQVIDPAETGRLWLTYADLAGITSVKNREIATQFERFEVVTGFPLPAELKAVYMLCDGAKRAFFGRDFLPLTQVIEEWQNWQAIYDEWSLSELMSVDPDGDKTLGMYINPKRVSFIDNIGGNFFGVDLMPGAGGKVGQIIAYGGDTYTNSVIADNLNQFLSLSIDRLRFPKRKSPLHRLLYDLEYDWED